MSLKVYVDRLSQPCRAVLLFCKVNGIEYEEIHVDLPKRQQSSPEFLEINPMGKVPAIAHERFKLFESHAILIYLACAFPGVADHWYPSDLFKRAKINSVLDWHHTNLRRGAGFYVFYSVLAPVFGLPLNPQEAAEAETLMCASLEKIESFWLEESGPFLLGNLQPSIADISLVCEIMQLELVDEKIRDRILRPHKKVLQWIENTKNATAPHFEEIHTMIFEFKAKLLKQTEVEAEEETEASRNI